LGRYRSSLLENLLSQFEVAPLEQGPGHLALVGPTASGKTALALGLARKRSDAEIVSVDSMAVYKRMDIGTAKPSRAERSGLQVHMIDLVEPSEDFTVTQYQSGARGVAADITARGHRALFVGGTGLYLRSVTDELKMPGRWPEVASALEDDADNDGVQALHSKLQKLDPVAAARIEPTNRRRVVRALEVTIGSGSPFSSFGPGLETYPPSEIVQVGIPYLSSVHDQRVRSRFNGLLEEGLLEEVRGLSKEPGGLSRTARQAIGYRELLDHIESGVPYDEAVQSAVQRTRVLARRQWSWFKRDPRIEWLDPSGDLAEQLLERWDAAARALAREPIAPGRRTPISAPVGD
jgi:tRNA dimethylallyltransferase